MPAGAGWLGYGYPDPVPFSQAVLPPWPIAPTPRRWQRTSAAVVASTVGLVLAASVAAPASVFTALGFIASATLCVAGSWFSPVAASVGFGVLLQIAAANSLLRSPLVIVAVLAIAAITGLRTTMPKSAICAVLLWYLIQTDLSEGIYFPIDLDTAIFIGLMIAAAWGGAVALRTTLVTRTRDAQVFQDQLEEERERTVKALHGSVAASLTSVVLRSESLAMASSGDMARSAQLIADDARRAMQEVRELIRFMRDDELPDRAMSNDAIPVIQALTTLVATLRSHGFTVIETGLNDEVIEGLYLRHISEVCREIQTNIMKYADPESPVIVAALRDDTAVTIAVQNTIAARQRDVHMTTGIGLDDAADLMRQDGAGLNHGYEGTQWRYELVIPVEPK